jgi:hypothetical protein
LHRQGIVIGNGPCLEDDMRAIQAAVRSWGDPDAAFAFRFWPLHDLGKWADMPDLHGSGAERLEAFRNGYRSGIPPGLFPPPLNGR